MAKKYKAAVVFIHGLAKKPPPEKLREIWLWGLGRSGPKPEVFGVNNPGLNLQDQGVDPSFNYWADVFYGTDYETDYRDQYENAIESAVTPANLDAVAGYLALPKPSTPREARFLAEFESQLMKQVAADVEVTPAAATVATAPGQFEIASWLPGPVKEAIIRKAAKEAYYYLFNKEYERPDGARVQVRRELRERLVRDLRAASALAEKVVIVSHSMGTMIAYDVLRNVDDCPQIDTLFTLGSPLGITEVQDELRAVGVTAVDFPAAKLLRWVNVFDPKDPICGVDPRFANDYTVVDGKKVEDLEESNWGSWRHTITHYLAGVRFRGALAGALGIDLS
ncbi:PGAP1-like alpha/beta domain-containing protein [Paucibacter sp. B51]|uniref:PGAP1-like alpha/beta domain-containing protein n=1 Tax=Paucibacter sp. B51 TaxID=2993315 RepID=UPI0022EBB316|nr:hypothetical protein [Paucibacter sp. B51]